MSVRVFQVPSPKNFDGRYGMPVIALVHHRMVGSLASTDVTFTTGTRPASTHFGVGYDCGKTGHPTGLAGAHVHQYVHVDDSAWGNGNLDTSGRWDDVYGATPNPNYRTISIEHHDNGGRALGDGKGVVPEEVLRVSIELDRLLLSGDWPAWKAAGITADTDGGGAAIAAQVKRIDPGPNTLVDHYYIAGRLKPYCWRPWADDAVGFPQARYLLALKAPTTPPEETMRSFTVPEARTLVMVPDKTWLYVSDAFAADPGNINVSPARELVLVGDTPGGAAIVAYETAVGDADSVSKTFYAKPGSLGGRRVVVDTTPISQAQYDALKAQANAGYNELAAAARAKIIP